MFKDILSLASNNWFLWAFLLLVGFLVLVRLPWVWWWNFVHKFYEVQLKGIDADEQKSLLKGIHEYNEDSWQQKRMQTKFIVYGISSLICFVYCITVAALVFNIRTDGKYEGIGAWGTVGDFFGGMLNPILAFASFMALLYTIRIQSEELRLTRAEFEKSVKAQQDAVESQRNQVSLQQKSLELNSIRYFLDSDLKSASEIFDTELHPEGNIESLHRCFKRGLFYKPNKDYDASWEERFSTVSPFMAIDHRSHRHAAALEDSTLNALAAYETMSVLSRSVEVSFFNEILLVYANRLTQYIVAIGLFRPQYIRYSKKIDISCPLLVGAIRVYCERHGLEFPPYINLGEPSIS